jgi:hypothetical protein
MTHTLLHASVMNAILATLLAMMVAPLARLFRGRPALVHGLWLLVLLKLVTPPVVQMPLPWLAISDSSAVSLNPFPPAPLPEAERGEEGNPSPPGPLPEAERGEEGNPSPPAPLPEAERGEQEARRASEGKAIGSLPLASDPSLPEAERGEEDSKSSQTALSSTAGSPSPLRGGGWGEGLSFSPSPLWGGGWGEGFVLTLWLTGALVCWSMAAFHLFRLSRLLRTLPPDTGEVAQRIAHLAAKLGLKRIPLAYLVPGVIPPMLLVLGRSSRLLLPAALWERLDPVQRDTLLLHELAHIRRADHRVRWLEVVVLGLYWWHPVAWWACRVVRDAEEECCDAWVVWAAPESGPAYASTLVETVAYLSGAPAALPAGASGAGPVRLIKRRLTMILRGSTPRCLSRPALVGMLLLGLGLLPLVPTLAQPAPEKLPADTRASAPAGKPVIERMPLWHTFHAEPVDPHWGKWSCQSCHETPLSRNKKAGAGKLHDEIVQLMDEVAKRRDQLTQAEAKLKDALKRFEAQQEKKAVPAAPKLSGRPPADRRLEDVERKLEQLLREVEKLRKDLRPNKTSSSSSGRNDVVYINKREFTIPVRWNSEPASRRVRLHVTSDGGKSYQAVASDGFRRESGRITGIPFKAPHDGEFGFYVVIENPFGGLPEPNGGQEPMMRVVVDTVWPKVWLKAEAESTGRIKVAWDVIDANLDLSTMRLEYRGSDDRAWEELSKPSSAKGICLLRLDAPAWEIRLRAKDKAGNLGQAVAKHPKQPSGATN